MPSYAPILILGAAALGFGVFTIVLSYLLGRPRPTAAKSATYECGVPPVGTARERFPIKFYLVCMIFILLDEAEDTQVAERQRRVRVRLEVRRARLVGERPRCSSPRRTRPVSTRSSRAIP